MTNSKFTPERWERQPGESVAAFAAFAHYRDSGPTRSVRSTAEHMGASLRTCWRWSRANEWVARAAWWDVEADRQRQRAYTAALVATQAERLARAERAATAAREMFEHLDVTDVTPSEVRHWQALADRLAVDAYGLTTAAPVPTVEPHHERVTRPEAIARLRLAAAQATALADEAERGRGGPLSDAERVARQIAQAERGDAA
ncbi:hypothetical protein [Demequina maris]|uniref:hypothetical protein n=1 Tax=Demequina maris TaxID=1638982 RepID=UPI000783FFA9|nr:hypothetical protein [Demequina maris]